MTHLIKNAFFFANDCDPAHVVNFLSSRPFFVAVLPFVVESLPPIKVDSPLLQNILVKSDTFPLVREIHLDGAKQQHQKEDVAATAETAATSSKKRHHGNNKNKPANDPYHPLTLALETVIARAPQLQRVSFTNFLFPPLDTSGSGSTTKLPPVDLSFLLRQLPFATSILLTNIHALLNTSILGLPKLAPIDYAVHLQLLSDCTRGEQRIAVLQQMADKLAHLDEIHDTTHIGPSTGDYQRYLAMVGFFSAFAAPMLEAIAGVERSEQERAAAAALEEAASKSNHNASAMKLSPVRLPAEHLRVQTFTLLLLAARRVARFNRYLMDADDFNMFRGGAAASFSPPKKLAQTAVRRCIDVCRRSIRCGHGAGGGLPAALLSDTILAESVGFVGDATDQNDREIIVLLEGGNAVVAGERADLNQLPGRRRNQRPAAAAAAGETSTESPQNVYQELIALVESLSSDHFDSSLAPSSPAEEHQRKILVHRALTVLGNLGCSRDDVVRVLLEWNLVPMLMSVLKTVLPLDAASSSSSFSSQPPEPTLYRRKAPSSFTINDIDHKLRKEVFWQLANVGVTSMHELGSNDTAFRREALEAGLEEYCLKMMQPDLPNDISCDLKSRAEALCCMTLLRPAPSPNETVHPDMESFRRFLRAGGVSAWLSVLRTDGEDVEVEMDEDELEEEEEEENEFNEEGEEEENDDEEDDDADDDISPRTTHRRVKSESIYNRPVADDHPIMAALVMHTTRLWPDVNHPRRETAFTYRWPGGQVQGSGWLLQWFGKWLIAEAQARDAARDAAATAEAGGVEQKQQKEQQQEREPADVDDTLTVSELLKKEEDLLVILCGLEDRHGDEIGVQIHEMWRGLYHVWGM